MSYTISEMFEQSVERFGQNAMLWEKTNGDFQSTTYSQIHRNVIRYAAGFLQQKIVKGDRLALLAEGRNDWVLAELAMLYIGAINVPLSVKLVESDELVFRLNHAEVRMIVVSANQLHKIRKIKSQLPQLQQVILLDEVDELEPDEIYWSSLYKEGEDVLQQNPDLVNEARKQVLPDDAANISYTSGTTANPKGIVLTHKNYITNVNQAGSLFDIPASYRSLLILPWDHSFAHTVGIYTLIKNGASLAAVKIGKTPMETLKNIPVNIKEIQPTFLLSVPALARNFKKNIENGIKAKGGFTEKLFNAALNVAYTYHGNGLNRGKGHRAFYKPLNALFDKLLFSKIRQAFGGKLKFFVGGGALLDEEIQRFFFAIGIPMYQGYGLSEAAPIISSNAPRKHLMGSSGIVVDNLQLKICDEDGNELPHGQTGEIVIKGDNVMHSYWRNPKATADTIKDGWLHTGDMGYYTHEGWLYVKGRYKSLLVSPDGEKYSPEGIEEALVDNSPFIEQAMLYNNQCPATVGLIVISQSKVCQFLKEKRLRPESERGREAIILRIREEINEYRPGGKYQEMFPERWLPSAFAILPEGFTEQNKLMNSTMKIVRPKIIERYKPTLDFLYTPEAKERYHAKNMEVLEKMFIKC